MNNSTTPLKTCSKCKQDKPATTEYFHRAKSHKDGLRYECRQCINRGDKRKEKALSGVPEGYKRCGECLQVFPATQDYFTPNKLGILGYRPECNECRRKIFKEKWETEHDVLLEKARHWRQRNPDKMKFYSLKRTENYSRTDAGELHYQLRKQNLKQCPKCKQVFSISYFLYNGKGKTRLRPYCLECESARLAEYSKQNPSYVLKNNARRRTRKKSLPYNFTRADWMRCFEWWGGCCAYCGNPSGLFKRMRICAEHVIPLVAPNCPGTVPSNIIPACRSCNSSKKDRSLSEWLTARYDLPRAAEILARIEAYFEWVRAQ